MSTYKIGQRLSFSSYKCTVRYVGPLPKTTGTWLGVEWDDPSRGKHNGEHLGQQYFSCTQWNASSFIRPNRPHDPPHSFVEALYEKYVTSLENSGIAKPVEFGTKVAEEVGFEKISAKFAELGELQYVLLDGSLVDRAEDREGEIKETCPNVRELDLSMNLFMSLEPIAQISRALEKLVSMRINLNRLSYLTLPPELSSAFTNIQELGAEDLNLTHTQILQLISHFPSLTLLSLALNNLNHLHTFSPPCATTLTELVLEGNTFTSLASLSALQHLPNLKRLKLSRSTISAVYAAEKDATCFPSVTYLDVSYNKISHWTFIDDLTDVFPNLLHLRISHNPLSEAGSEEGFMFTVGRLKRSVVKLNFSTITDAERLNAEVYYLGKIVKELNESPEDQQSFILSKHRRWEELQSLYGEQTIDRTIKTDSKKTMGSKLVELQLVHSTRTISKRVPRTMTVSALKSVVGKLFALSPLSVRLVVADGEGGADDPMDDELRDVGYYVEGAGGKVTVEEA